MSTDKITMEAISSNEPKTAENINIGSCVFVACQKGVSTGKQIYTYIYIYIHMIQAIAKRKAGNNPLLNFCKRMPKNQHQRNSGASKGEFAQQQSRKSRWRNVNGFCMRAAFKAKEKATTQHKRAKKGCYDPLAVGRGGWLQLRLRSFKQMTGSAFKRQTFYIVRSEKERSLRKGWQPVARGSQGSGSFETLQKHAYIQM